MGPKRALRAGARSTWYPPLARFAVVLVGMNLAVDVTLCPGDGCSLRAQCVRARALPAARQDWFGRPPWDATTGRCDAFWDVASLAPSADALRVAAYHRWQRRGCPEGSPERDWADAEADWAARIAASLRPLAPPSEA